MKTTVAKLDLLEALNRVRWTVSGSKMIQLYQCFCFKDGKVSTFNGAAGTITNCGLDGMDFACPADRFFRLINAMPSDITLDLKDSGRLYIGSGGNRTYLGTHSTKGFPETIPDDATTFCDAEDFLQCMVKVHPAIGVNATKPNLMGVGIKDDFVYACDGRRASRARLKNPANGAVLIPSDAVEHINRLGKPDFMFSCQGGNVVGAMYKDTKTVYRINCIAHEFPFTAVNQMFSDCEKINMTDFPEGMPEAISRVELLAPPEETAIIVESSSGMLKLSSKSEEGEAEETLSWPFQETFRFAVAPAVFKKAFETSRRVDLTDVVKGINRKVYFEDDEGFESILALMAVD